MELNEEELALLLGYTPGKLYTKYMPQSAGNP